MIAVIDSARAPSLHYDSEQREDPVQIVAPNPPISVSVSNMVNLNSQLEDPSITATGGGQNTRC